jgi:uncharacterized protein (TIGR02594 family)
MRFDMRRFLIAVTAGLCLVTTVEARPHRTHPIHYNGQLNTGLPYSGPPVEDARMRCDEQSGCIWKDHRGADISLAVQLATTSFADEPSPEAELAESVPNLPRQVAAATIDLFQNMNTRTAELVARARHYLGTNPTGWRHVWCGRFMAMIAPRAARRIGNPNLAKNWARLPHTSPHIGAIAVLRRNGGGHVGVVAGFRGHDPILISGNHGHRVGIGVYPAHRVIAYVKG